PNSAPLPFLDAFAGESVRFTQAVAPAAWTLASQASMLTGLYPNHHGATDPRVVLSDTVPTLAGQLSSTYETVGFTNSVYFDPSDVSTGGCEKSVCDNDPRKHPPKPAETPPDPVLVRGGESAPSRPASPRPLFLFVQTFAIHNYYQEPLSPDD